jgi:hypothetical protein
MFLVAFFTYFYIFDLSHLFKYRFIIFNRLKFCQHRQFYNLDNIS